MITSRRVVQIEFSGDVTSNENISALDNELSYGVVDLVTLTAGANNIFPPSVVGFLVTALTIIPPAGNAVIFSLRGDPNDVGIPLHPTDPTSIALNVSFVSLVIVIPALTPDVLGVRMIWS